MLTKKLLDELPVRKETYRNMLEQSYSYVHIKVVQALTAALSF